MREEKNITTSLWSRESRRHWDRCDTGKKRANSSQLHFPHSWRASRARREMKGSSPKVQRTIRREESRTKFRFRKFRENNREWSSNWHQLGKPSPDFVRCLLTILYNFLIDLPIHCRHIQVLVDQRMSEEMSLRYFACWWRPSLRFSLISQFRSTYLTMAAVRGWYFLERSLLLLLLLQ